MIYKKIKVAFIGCVKSSYEFLKQLCTEDCCEVVCVITSEKNEFNSDYVDLGTFCDNNNIECYYTRDINDDETYEYVLSKKPDVIYCFGWSRLIKKRLLEFPELGVVGYHPAELPNNRGRHPIIWALALGLHETASTFFKMDENADTGMILSQKKVEILEEDNAGTLYDKLLSVGVEQVSTFTKELANGTACYLVQESGSGNTWRKRSKNDGRIDWRMSSKSIYNLVRALTHPYVGAHFEYNGVDYKVWKVLPEETNYMANIEQGKVINVTDDEIVVKVADGFIHLLECDRPKVKAGDYII